MKQIKAILIGAGLRGMVYSNYALEHSEEFKVVAVAEPDEEKRNKFAKLHKIPIEMQFSSYDDLFEKGKIADCAMVCTPDRLHIEPVLGALELNYHVLCEKPMSPNADEIFLMGKMSKKYDRILSICHVLRYSPFFVKLKSLIEDEKIGKVMSIQHIEEVGFWHHAHSFVRGNWRNSEESSPMILQKCCHDMDILLWLIGSKCKSISSYGKLTFFKEENAPIGASRRCMDSCPHRDECEFYAPKFYLEHPRAEVDGLVYAVAPSGKKEDILEALRTGVYGRCVFHCDNDVVDHQVVNIEFENEVNVSFSMIAFTNDCARKINIMGTKGQIYGDMEKSIIKIHNFLTGDVEIIKLNAPNTGHSGSDKSIMKDFVRQVAEGKAGKTGADISVESHLMALAAEESRLSGKSVDFRDYLQALEN